MRFRTTDLSISFGAHFQAICVCQVPFESLRLETPDARRSARRRFSEWWPKRRPKRANAATQAEAPSMRRDQGCGTHSASNAAGL
jgi:hypothetical protein